ncbi:MAG: bifunctional 4'-phosphopantothenoylcysteine decarboxylase/phosphopantothenoylcysteine synthetase, partial [Candidatus Omnitrophica bacterium]|nr:bifunctional 4'-phosphopantothenoylcysteine decarboxylase/phosphopantothenoylcysteine synthetase [Candidatus Omnitrophota bacterium]
IMTAAVCDFRPERTAKKKIKRKEGGIVLSLKQNPDILGGLGRKKGKKMLVGFALETEDLKKNAQDKLRQKNLDLIVATQMKASKRPFGQVRIDALIMDRKGRAEKIKRATKKRLSGILLERIEKM